MDNKLLPEIKSYIKTIYDEIDNISEKRKEILQKLTHYIELKVRSEEQIKLNFICTHNSRRSHMSQVWAQTAAKYFNIKNVQCYSGGSEETELNKRSVNALRNSGFKIDKLDQSKNPNYNIYYSKEDSPIKAFSKVYSHPTNPQSDFAAIMTCSDADEACPVILGADTRIPIMYNDPKVSDNTPEEETVYNERCKEIAVEMLYVFSMVKS